MKAFAVALMVTTLAVQALPAQAQETLAPAASVTDDLPLTPRFASLVSSYRDCVLQEVEKVSLGDQRMMAQQAMEACAIARGELQAQLLSDIAARSPAFKPAALHRAAQTGMEQIDPMVEQAAIDWAHVRYARTMR